MPGTLRGIVINYRTGHRTQRCKEMILEFPDIKTVGEASRLVGRKVAWPINQRKIRGKILGLHGRRAMVRARFRKGLPGTAIGTGVEIIS